MCIRKSNIKEKQFLHRSTTIFVSQVKLKLIIELIFEKSVITSSSVY